MNKKVALGTLFILLGLVFLFLRTDVYLQNFIWVLVRLWPLVLVAIGLGMIFKKQKGLKTLIWLLLVVTIGGLSLVANRFAFFREADQMIKLPQAVEYKESTSYRLPESRNELAKLMMKMGSGELYVNGGNLPLLEASLPKDLVTLKHEVKENTDLVTIEDENTSFNLKRSTEAVYDLTLSENQSWEISIDTGAIDALLDLRTLSVSEVLVNMGAGDIELVLSDLSDHMAVEINSGASDITISVPRSVGFSLEMGSVINDVAIEGAYKKVEGGYESSNYDKRNRHIDIKIASAVTSVSVELR